MNKVVVKGFDTKIFFNVRIDGLISFYFFALLLTITGCNNIPTLAAKQSPQPTAIVSLEPIAILTQTPMPTLTPTQLRLTLFTETKIPTETKTPISPTSSPEETVISFLEKWGMAPIQYKILYDKSGLMQVFDQRTGKLKLIYQEGKFADNFAIEMAEKDCQKTDWVQESRSNQPKTNVPEFNKYTLIIMDETIKFLHLKPGKKINPAKGVPVYLGKPDNCWVMWFYQNNKGKDSDADFLTHLVYHNSSGAFQIIPVYKSK